MVNTQNSTGFENKKGGHDNLAAIFTEVVLMRDITLISHSGIVLNTRKTRDFT